MASVEPRLDTASPTVATPEAKNAAMESVVPACVHGFGCGATRQDQRVHGQCTECKLQYQELGGPHYGYRLK